MAGGLEAKVLELSHMLQSKQAEVDHLKSELEEAEKVRKTTTQEIKTSRLLARNQSAFAMHKYLMCL